MGFYELCWADVPSQGFCFWLTIYLDGIGIWDLLGRMTKWPSGGNNMGYSLVSGHWLTTWVPTKMSLFYESKKTGLTVRHGRRKMVKMLKGLCNVAHIVHWTLAKRLGFDYESIPVWRKHYFNATFQIVSLPRFFVVWPNKTDASILHVWKLFMNRQKQNITNVVYN